MFYLVLCADTNMCLPLPLFAAAVVGQIRYFEVDGYIGVNPSTLHVTVGQQNNGQSLQRIP